MKEMLSILRTQSESFKTMIQDTGWHTKFEEIGSFGMEGAESISIKATKTPEEP